MMRNEQGQFIVGHVSPKRGLGLDEQFGPERALEIKQRISETMKKQPNIPNKGQFVVGTQSPKRGLTYQELYGEEKATEISKKLSESHIGQISPMRGKKRRPHVIEVMKPTMFQKGHRPWNTKLFTEPTFRTFSKEWIFLTRKIRKRDKYRCQNCDIKPKTTLHVHHIIPKRLGGPDEEWNLLSLCPSCHRTIENSGGGIRI